MRHRGKANKRDANEPEVIAAFEALGARVQKLNETGCPDLLVGYRRHNHLVEVKDGSKAPSQRALTDDQVCWMDRWPALVYVVKSADEVALLVGLWAKLDPPRLDIEQQYKEALKAL